MEIVIGMVLGLLGVIPGAMIGDYFITSKYGPLIGCFIGGCVSVFLAWVITLFWKKR